MCVHAMADMRDVVVAVALSAAVGRLTTVGSIRAQRRRVAVMNVGDCHLGREQAEAKHQEQ